jgi:signal transduction histidine kinase
VSRLRWSHAVPDGLAARFALLLAGALVAINLVAVALLSSERQRLGRALSEGRAIERLALIVPLIEAAAPEDRARIAELAEDRFARVELEAEPIVGAGETDARATLLLRQTLAALGSGATEVRAAALSAPRGGRDGPPAERLALSVEIAPADGRAPAWLNIVARPSRRPPDAERLPLLLVLLLSLAAVLAVGLLFIRRLTRPLAALAAAARAAGRGDQSARVAETGARELRETARAFNEMQTRIARFDAERTRTLAAVGHDLRTPITSLRIRAEMLDEPDREPMVRTLDEMTVMADGLVAYARGQGDAEEVVAVDLAALLGRLCAERGAGFVSTRPATVRGRPVALARAFGNLVDNALRYGSAARVRVDPVEDDAVVTVDDDGPGIPPERIEAMFEPFVRGEASRSLETGGVGLGLAIARAIIRAHGGDVTLANRDDGGLRARILLPLDRTAG